MRLVHARGEVAVDESGRPVVVHGTCQDVTEARRIEDALRATEQLFRRAFDDSPIGMALIDLEGRWLRLNRALRADGSAAPSPTCARRRSPRSATPRTSTSTGR